FYARCFVSYSDVTYVLLLLSSGGSYRCLCFLVCFFNATATTEIYTLSLHDALPISAVDDKYLVHVIIFIIGSANFYHYYVLLKRSEEHTSELQSRENLVCRLLLEKKKTNKQSHTRREINKLQHYNPIKANTSTQLV